MSEKNLPVELMSQGDLVPYEKNTKIHTPEQVSKIAAAIKEFGFDQPIVVDKNLVIIKGHGRRLASLELGLKKVPVVVRTDLTDEQIRALRIVDNKVAEGGHDVALMEEEIRGLVVDMDFDMADFMDARELDFLIDDLGDMDLGAVSEDLANEVEERTTKTQSRLSEEDAKEQGLAKVFGFKALTGAQARAVRRFMAFIEGETGASGAEALTAHAEFVLGGPL